MHAKGRSICAYPRQLTVVIATLVAVLPAAHPAVQTEEALPPDNNIASSSPSNNCKGAADHDGRCEPPGACAAQCWLEVEYRVGAVAAAPRGVFNASLSVVNHRRGGAV